jgi:hypothetical protein
VGPQLAWADTIASLIVGQGTMSRYKTDEYREKHAEYMRGHRSKHPTKNAERMKRYKELNPEKHRATQENADLQKHYGITTEQRDEMLKSQDYRCAICRSEHSGRKGMNWCVDHCHTTKKVRGVLCHPCNSLLGYAKDNRKTLAAAIQYLAIHQEDSTELRRLSWEPIKEVEAVE